MKYRIRYEGLHVGGVFHAPQIGLPRERIAKPEVRVVKRRTFTEGNLAELAKLLQGAKV